MYLLFILWYGFPTWAQLTDCPMSDCSPFLLRMYCAKLSGGGNVTATNCTPGGGPFMCTCNDAVSVMIERKDGQCLSPVTMPSPWCEATTGVCPSDCTEATTLFSQTCADTLTGKPGNLRCNERTGIFSCAMCNGNILTMTLGGARCEKSITEDASKRCRACGAHACCGETPYAPCACHSHTTKGFWSGEMCVKCDTKHEGVECDKEVGSAQAFFNELGTGTLTMVTPMMGCLVVLVIMSAFRRRWTYDKTPEHVHSNFTDLFVEGKFKDKRIPDRPARSTGIANRMKERESGAKE